MIAIPTLFYIINTLSGEAGHWAYGKPKTDEEVELNELQN